MLLRKLLLLMSIGVLGVGLAPGTGTVGADDDDDGDWEDRWGDWDDGPRFRAWRGDWYAPPPVYYTPAPVYRYGYYEAVPYRVYAPPPVYVQPRVYRWAGPVLWESWD